MAYIRGTVALALAFLASSKALATDCKKAATPVEKMVCGDAKLKAADAALNGAYFKLLRSVKDKEFHAALIASQRRWLKTWNAQQFDPKSEAAEKTRVGGETDITTATNEDLAIVANEIKYRIEDLTVHESLGEAPLINHMDTQKQFISRYTGGAYAGFDIGCFFAPWGFGDGVYVCVGAEVYQNKNRVCRITTDWASSHGSEYRTVATVVGNNVKMNATCAMAYSGVTCPTGEKDDDGRWNFKPDVKDETPTFNVVAGTSLKRFDPDVPFRAYEAEPWLHACLTDPNYPEKSTMP